MNLLKNVKVKIKLVVAFLIVAFLIGVVGGVGIVSLENVGENAEKIYNQDLKNVYMLTDMKENSSAIERDMLQLIYVKDSSKEAELEKKN
ncbi:MAG: methyl-accepting chemotaxis protein [Clostridium butyricum]|nr:methyl-accepting chemotaxis protein [Clostridium butyricum]